MNLYLRLLFIFIVAKFKKRVSLFEEIKTSHRVFPNDLDLFGHMNNGRYFTVTDIARIDMLIRSGLWQELKKRKIIGVNAGQTVQFRKPLRPFQKYEIITKTIGWDNKHFYVENRFVSKKGVHALVLIRVRVMGIGKEKPTPAEILRHIYSNKIQENKMNRFLNIWNESSQMHWGESMVPN